MKKACFLIMAVLTALIGKPALATKPTPESFVQVLRVEGVINPVISSYIEEGLTSAQNNGAAAVLIELDTPGGLLDATRSIISSIINSEIPVIVYVAPRGSRATSAGVFIMMGADVAAMAPETHIGAAHPVNVGGDTPALPEKEKGKKGANDSSVMSEKMVSDASAYIRTLATERGRNAEWAEKAVRESVSLTSDEALKQNVIDYVATSTDELMSQLTGKTLLKNGKKFTLNIQNGIGYRPFPMSAAKKFLHKLAHPNVAYILMTIGIYGLIYELATPGIGMGGGVGLICLLLAFFSLQILPINTVGVALIVLGMVLLLFETFAPSHGLLTFGGLVSFALGSFMLIDIKASPVYARVSFELIAGTVGVTALFFGYALRKAFQARRAKPKIGQELLIGKSGVAKTALDPEGMVFLEGELWTARSHSPLNAGDEVVVTHVDGNKLSVKKKEN